MSSRRKSTNNNKNNSDIEESDSQTESKRYWNSSALTKHAHLEWLARWLPNQSSRYDSIITRGCYLDSKGTTVTVSIEQAVHLFFNNVKYHDFKDPCPAGSFTIINASLDVTSILTPTTAATGSAPAVFPSPSSLTIMPVALAGRFRAER